MYGSIHIALNLLKSVGKSPHDIFLDHYDALSNLLSASMTTLTPYFISARILSVSDQEEISALANPNDKALMLLKKISAALKSGFHKSFRDMLSLMCIYGNNDIKELSQNITALLPNKFGMYSVEYVCKYITCAYLLLTKGTHAVYA